MKPCEFIEKLAAENKPMADALENKRFSGMKGLLADFYPDNAHFIYELLQNAEDTHATKISFELQKDRLIYQHNGKRTFTERDIESITSIGYSSKADDINSIGKFGVGFKAVFSYTNSPQIYSGDYSFEINNLVVPKCVDDFSRISTDTIFIFPFDNPKKPKIQAFKEIQAGLEKLHENTLLFLKNIAEISVVTKKQCYAIKRNEIDDIQVEIHNSQKNSLSRWLRFKKPLPDFPNLYVSVAYAIGENEKQKNEIIPIKGEVSIFFPAEGETSNLRFHIHAPFLSTVARDKIKDLDENMRFINLISETVADSFNYIKSNNLLTLAFLGVLPNHKDKEQTDPFYHPIYLKSIEAFQKQPYMLTESGEYQPSDVCYRGLVNLKRLISDEDLRILTKYTNVYWSKNAPQTSRAYDFISSLEIEKFDDEDFYSKLSEISLHYGNNAGYREEDNEEFKSINSLFSSKSDEWYLKFYLFLHQYHQDDYYYNDYRELKFFIRLDNGELNIDGRDCFFNNGIIDKNFLYVKKETYSIASKQEDNLKAKSFLESLGVKEVGDKEKIEAILDLYKDDTFPDFDDHLNHIDTFLDYFKNSNNASIFENKHFIACTSTEDGKNYWGEPSDIVMDAPYLTTGLEVIAQYVIDKRYMQKLSDSNLKDFITFCKAIGIVYKLKIIQTSVYFNPEWPYGRLRSSGKNVGTSTNIDWTIEDLNDLIENQNTKITLLIWDTIRLANPMVLEARHQKNRSAKLATSSSQLVHSLRNSQWISDKNGIFHKPSDISKDDLPKEFLYDDRNGWLTAIGFGENIRKNQQEYREKEKIAKEITGGHDFEDIEALRGVPPEVLKAFLAQQKSKNNPKNSIEKKPLDVIGAIQKHTKNINHNNAEIDPTIVKNNEVYLDTLRKQHNHTIQKSKIAKQKNYSTKIKSGGDDTGIFLQNQYKGHCQICGFTFTKTDGRNYFELLDWGAEKITKIRSNLILPASSLCVCPNCHSSVKLGDFQPDFLEKLDSTNLNNFTFEQFCEGTKTRVEHAEIPECYSFIEIDMYKIPIHLNQEKKFIFYTEEHFLHFFDLACLNKNGGK